jgi:glutathione S-transferase
MKLHTSIGPNPRVVKMFIAEKGIDIPRVNIDLMGGENRQAPYTGKNPRVNALSRAGDGTYSPRSYICEYRGEVPKPPLVGTTPEERGTRMWARRIDLNIVEPMANGFRYGEGLMLFKNRIRTIPQAADDLKTLGSEKLAWLDGLMKDNQFIAGSRFTLADILLFAFLDFGRTVGQPFDTTLTWIPKWFERIEARPSAAASV